MKKRFLFTMVIAALFLVASCESGGDGGDELPAQEVAEVTGFVVNEVIDDLGDAMAASARALYEDSATINSDIGGSATVDFIMNIDDDDGGMSGDIDMTFNAYQVDVDGEIYTVGGGLFVEYEASLAGEFSETMVGTITVAADSGGSGSFSINLSMTATIEGTIMTVTAVGTVGGEAVNETETIDLAA